MAKQGGGIFGLLRRVGPWTALALFAGGIVFWGGFNWAIEATNSEAFCVSCHAMRENVFKEYQDTVHYTNRSGVRATCSDCHVPKAWAYKIARKVRASNEVFHWIIGTVNTPEKFNARRIVLAQLEWDRMKATDSRECRNCHHYDYMDFPEQGRRAVAQHSVGFTEGKTCIDCHKGVAHALPPIEQHIGAPKLVSAH
jgi:cytochrome c-type protein NapC